MTAHPAHGRYHERLVPGLGFFAALLLVIPAVFLVMIPINSAAAAPTAIGVYLVLVAFAILGSPTLDVRDGVFRAGRASIPVELLGEIEPLGSDSLKAAIGPGADARNFLVLRGWIHRGVRIEIVDENDPTPNWIVTSRKPLALAEALRGVTP